MQHYAVFETIPLYNDLPTIPDTEIAFVSELPGNAYQIYGPAYFNSLTKRYSHKLLAVLFQDPSNNWIVGCDDSALLDKIGVYESLQDVVSNKPSKWHTYKCEAEYDSSGFYEIEILKVTTYNKGILIALGVANPHAIGLFNIVATQATIPSQVGIAFRPDEVEANTIKYGNFTLQSVQALNHKRAA